MAIPEGMQAEHDARERLKRKRGERSRGGICCVCTAFAASLADRAGDLSETRSSMKRLSVAIITLNEAERLGQTLEAVKDLADEIIVVDAHSTDATAEIAVAAGATVIVNTFVGYGEQKRFAEDQTTNDWILNLDADEVVTPRLAAELAAWKRDGSSEPACYEVDILNIYPGDTTPRPFARDYRVVRLYDKTRLRYRDHPLFDRVEVPAGMPKGSLKAPIHHFPVVTFEQMVMKANRLSSVQAEKARPKPRWLLLVRLVTEFPLTFAKIYFLRLHILGGWKGLAFSIVNAFSRTLRIIKMLERE
ncbi:MAG: glycosyltransferase family 2 protein [Rhizobiaceae bacterium]